MLNKYIERLLKFIEEEKEEINKELNQVEEHFGKPVVVENKAAEEYLLLLNNIKDYTEKNTKNGEYKPDDWSTININKKELIDIVTKELGTEDGKKYINVIGSGNTKEFTTMTTVHGKKIGRLKENGIRNPEGEKASEYGHKIKVIIGEGKKSKKSSGFDGFINPTEAT